MSSLAMSSRRVRWLIALVPAVVIVIALWSARVHTGEQAPSANSEARADRAALTMQPVASNQASTPAQSVKTATSVEPGLTLFATLPGRNSREGSATLGTSPETAKRYAAGALLANRMRLAEIHPQFVVLERNGERQSLYVQGSAQAGGDAARVPELTTSSDPASTQLPAPSRDALSEVVRAMAHYEHDALAGLELHAGAREQSFKQLGLEEGDVLIEIDGAPVTDVQAATQQLRSVISGAALPVQLRRGGTLTTLTLDGAAVASSMRESPGESAASF